MTKDDIISDDVAKLFLEKNLAFLATLMKDGSPQITPTWVDLENNTVLINTAEGRVKQRNVTRDPRVAVSIVDHRNVYNMVTIRGIVMEQTTKGADEHVDKLAKKYLGVDKYPFRSANEKRVILRIKPEKIFRIQP